MKRIITLFYAASMFLCLFCCGAGKGSTHVPHSTGSKSQTHAEDTHTHQPEYTFSQEGVPAGYCVRCGEYIAPAGDSWIPLTSMKVVSHSNSSSGMDIQIGTWSDPVGAVYWNALNFWVVDGPGFNKTEYMEFSLTGARTTLSGTVTAAGASAESAVM